MNGWDAACDRARDMTDQELRDAADGCTEISCMYHGPVNWVRLERGIR